MVYLSCFEIYSALFFIFFQGCLLGPQLYPWNEKDTDKDHLVCINPAILANAISCLHRYEENVQDIVVMVNENRKRNNKEGLWFASMANDWTLREAFLDITKKGIIREVLVALFLHVSIVTKGKISKT